MRAEVLANERVQLVILERVPVARGGVGVRGRLRQRWVPRDGQHRVYHEIDRDDVNDALGDAGELGDVALAVGEDDRLGHLETLDPAGPRVHEGPLEDRGAKEPEREAPRRPELPYGSPHP